MSLVYPHPPKEWAARSARDRAAIHRLLHAVLRVDSNAVDVGAHEGSILGEILRLAPRGRHTAVEALPHLAARLAERFPSASILNIAACDTTGTATFLHVISRPAWSGLRLQQYPSEPQIEEVTVTLARLDDTVDLTHPVAFLKIDVEGAECLVLAGAQGLLTAHRPVILFEHAKIHALHYEAEATTPYRLLVDSLDYAICDLETVKPLSEARFEDNFHNSYNSGYGLDSQTNFVAVPAEKLSNLRDAIPAD